MYKVAITATANITGTTSGISFSLAVVTEEQLKGPNTAPYFLSSLNDSYIGSGI